MPNVMNKGRRGKRHSRQVALVTGGWKKKEKRKAREAFCASRGRGGTMKRPSNLFAKLNPPEEKAKAPLWPKSLRGKKGEKKTKPLRQQRGANFSPGAQEENEGKEREKKKEGGPPSSVFRRGRKRKTKIGKQHRYF